MTARRTLYLRRIFCCWNWKCALMSASARSVIYLAAMAHTGMRGRLAVVSVEILYVTLTAGVYAGMQQRALEIRSRLLSNLIVALGVPGLAQWLDWITHRVTGAAATGRATLAVSLFAVVSGFFHLHVMRNGVFLTGQGRSLSDDFRRVPRLVLGFVLKPVAFFNALTSRPANAVESEAAL
jgi:hypothetical protein